MRSSVKYLTLAMVASCGAFAAAAQDIENDVPVTAEATTAIVPGKAAEVSKETGTRAAAATAKPDHIYTDGALADPNPKAEDLGMAQPGSKITMPVSDDHKK